MIDPVSVAIIAGTAFGGWLVGRHGRLRAQAKQPLPICMCTHHYGEHGPATGECLAAEKMRFQESPGASYKDIWAACPCARYTGPQPVEQYWVPPSADMSIVTAETDGGEVSP